MAIVVWTNKAKETRRNLYVQGVIKFGVHTAKKTAQKIMSITERLEWFPEMGYIEPLLEGITPTYRACYINRRFKIIYWYDKKNDKVVIENIWDIRREPSSLIKKIGEVNKK